MKVLLVNGSPHQHGCTDMALRQTAEAFEKLGVSTEIFWVGSKPVSGCIGCGACKKGLGRCAIDDVVNEFVLRAAEADGFVFGSPVHYAAISGAMCSFMDRAFYSGGKNMAFKPAAGVVSCRRGGASAAFDQLNKYFTISGMPVASSQYWNSIHGNNAQEAAQDAEGLQVMRTLGRNVAFLVKSIAFGKEAMGLPEKEKRVGTNFIR